MNEVAIKDFQAGVVKISRYLIKIWCSYKLTLKV